MRRLFAARFFLALAALSPPSAASPKPTAERIALSGGVVAIRDSAGVWVEPPGKAPKLVWQGDGALRGDPGERSGEVARFEDLTGDEQPELVVGTVYEPVKLCGAAEPPLLFRRAYDPKTQSMRTVAARRRLPSSPLPTLEARLGEEFPPSMLALPEAVSSIAGSDTELWSLLGPRGLVDGNPKTMWVPGSGDGRGEFVTFRLPHGPYGVVRIGLRPVPQGDRQSSSRYDRPRTLLLLLEKSAYRLELEKDPIGHPNQTLWFDLPAPAASICASLVVETTFEPERGGPLAIADLAVITQADGDLALPLLARDLASSERRGAAAALLERRGPLAAEAVNQIFDALDAKGRIAALKVLARTDAAKAMSRLVDAALGEDEAQRRIGLSGMQTEPQAAIENLIRRLASAASTQALLVIDAIDRLPAPLSARALVSRAGSGGREVRVAMRNALGRAAARSNQAAMLVAELLEAPLSESEEVAGKEPVLDALRAASKVRELRPLVLRRTLELSAEDSSFSTQYRLIEVAEALGCDAPSEVIRRALGHSDGALRARAVQAAGACLDSDITGELAIVATQDTDVSVRLAGWTVLSRLPKTATAALNLPTLYAGEPWPAVRVHIAAAGRPGNRSSQELLTTAANDLSPLVRVAVLEATIDHSEAFADELVLSCLSNNGERLLVRAAAARAAGRRCQDSAAQALFGLLKRGAEPMARSQEIEAAMAAAAALGELGTSEARYLLEKAARRSNPILEKAISAALARRKTDCAVPAAR